MWGDDRMPTDKVRILVVGDSGVGKSVLVEALCHAEDPELPATLRNGPASEKLRGRLAPVGRRSERVSWTVGVNLDVKLYIGNGSSTGSKHGGVKGRPGVGGSGADGTGTRGGAGCWIEFWDVSGSSRYALSRPVFYGQALNGIILVHDLTNRKSSDNLRRWLKDILQAAPKIDDESGGAAAVATGAPIAASPVSSGLGSLGGTPPVIPLSSFGAGTSVSPSGARSGAVREPLSASRSKVLPYTPSGSSPWRAGREYLSGEDDYGSPDPHLRGFNGTSPQSPAVGSRGDSSGDGVDGEDPEEGLELELLVGDRLLAVPLIVVGTHEDIVKKDERERREKTGGDDPTASYGRWGKKKAGGIGGQLGAVSESVEVDCHDASLFRGSSPVAAKFNAFFNKVIDRKFGLAVGGGGVGGVGGGVTGSGSGRVGVASGPRKTAATSGSLAWRRAGASGGGDVGSNGHHNSAARLRRSSLSPGRRLNFDEDKTKTN